MLTELDAAWLPPTCLVSSVIVSVLSSSTRNQLVSVTWSGDPKSQKPEAGELNSSSSGSTEGGKERWVLVWLVRHARRVSAAPASAAPASVGE